MITPIITSLTREVFATVPPAQKEAALALGATRWEMIRGVGAARTAASGMVGARHASGSAGRWARRSPSRSSSARATSDHAPQLFSPGDSMAAVIANQFGEATGTYRAALIGLGVVLFVLTIIVERDRRAIVRGPLGSEGEGRMTAADDRPRWTDSTRGEARVAALRKTASRRR